MKCLALLYTHCDRRSRLKQATTLVHVYVLCSTGALLGGCAGPDDMGAHAGMGGARCPSDHWVMTTALRVAAVTVGPVFTPSYAMLTALLARGLQPGYGHWIVRVRSLDCEGPTLSWHDCGFGEDMSCCLLGCCVYM